MKRRKYQTVTPHRRRQRKLPPADELQDERSVHSSRDSGRPTLKSVVATFPAVDTRNRQTEGSGASASRSELPLLLSVTAAAEMLGVSRSTAYTLIAEGQIPYVRLGSVMRIPRTALQTWVSKSTRFRQAPETEAGF